MKVLHTSDWHIGRILQTRKRYEEFEAFLDWLAETVEEREIDVIVISGDIFDNTTPSNRSQELYYRFLCRMALSKCRHVVVTAGNHDSPSFLNAPKELLKALNVHVIGNISESPENEVITLSGKNGEPGIIVCAVPYLRDRDIRRSEEGESIEDKERILIDGIKKHFRDVCAAAEARRKETGARIPIVAMGHLYAAGGKVVDGDGVRELYIGNLAQVGADIFPESIDYLALGHLHIEQSVGGSEFVRYSGSPLPMGFAEAAQEKCVLEVEFGTGAPSVKRIPVPCFQELRTIKGDWDRIKSDIRALKKQSSTAWLEVIYEGDEIPSSLNERLEELTAGSKLEIVRSKSTRIIERALSRMHAEETLDDLEPADVFLRCLNAHNVPEVQRKALINAYNEALSSLFEEDVAAA